MIRRARSFRVRLAVRIAAALGALVIIGSFVGYGAFRTTLYERLDAVLLRLAAIEAAATADSPNESVHFHDDVFVGPGSGHDSVLVRYAEVWTLGGVPVLHTSNLGAEHLPLPADVRQRVAAAGRPELFVVTVDGQRFRSVLYPLGLAGPQHQAHLLQVAVSTRDTDATVRRLAVFLLVLVGVGIVAGGSVGWWLAGFAVRPVLGIIAEAEAMDASGHGHRITVEGDTAELQRLVAVLNALLGRIDSVIDGQQRFVADAGHAIKTPLTVLRGNIDVALRKPRGAEEYRSVLERSLANLREVSTLAEDLIRLARSDGRAQPPAAEAVRVSTVVEDVVRRFTPAAAAAGIELRRDPVGDIVMEADESLLARALDNIVDNAVKYAGRGAQVTVLARLVAPALVEIAVHDTGPGIPRAERAHVFDRFYRGERARETSAGSGLGLAISKASVESFGATVALHGEDDVGTTVVIRGRATAGGRSHRRA